MFLEMAHQTNQYINSLQEPTRFFVYLALYVGLPIILVGLIILDKKIENKKLRKHIEKCQNLSKDVE